LRIHAKDAESARQVATELEDAFLVSEEAPAVPALIGSRISSIT
jgi:hypothetical protein